VDLAQAIDTRAQPNRELEPRRVSFDVIRRLPGRGIRPARRREGPARETVVAGRREEAERVPAARAPGTANPLVGVEDHERPSELLQVVADGQAGLAAADHDRLEVLD